MKKIHYTDGYGGKLNYETYCGKEIHSHDKKEEVSINPRDVNCKKCISTKEWKDDYHQWIGIDADGEKIVGVKRRIYLESDVLHASELRTAQLEVSSICEDSGQKYSRRVFQEVVEYAWHDLEKTWNAVKKADEIYSDSSLMPLIGNSYVGAPVIFNGMCERAIKEKVTGKSVFILNELKNIYWDMIDVKLFKSAFKKNFLYMYNEAREIEQVDITKVVNELKAKTN